MIMISMQFMVAEKSFTQTKEHSKPKFAKITDYDRATYFDVNRIKMAVTNLGWFCVGNDFMD